MEALFEYKGIEFFATKRLIGSSLVGIHIEAVNVSSRHIKNIVVGAALYHQDGSKWLDTKEYFPSLEPGERSYRKFSHSPGRVSIQYIQIGDERRNFDPPYSIDMKSGCWAPTLTVIGAVSALVFGLGTILTPIVSNFTNG